MVTLYLQDQIKHRGMWSSDAQLAHHLLGSRAPSPTLARSLNRKSIETLCRAIDNPYDHKTNTILVRSDAGITSAIEAPTDGGPVHINTFLGLDQRLKQLNRLIPGIEEEFIHFMTFVTTRQVPLKNGDGTEVYGFINDRILNRDSQFRTASLTKMLRIAAEYLGVKAFILPRGLRSKVNELSVGPRHSVLPFVLGGHQALLLMDDLFTPDEIAERTNPRDSTHSPLRDLLNTNNAAVVARVRQGEGGRIEIVQEMHMTTPRSSLYPGTVRRTLHELSKRFEQGNCRINLPSERVSKDPTLTCFADVLTLLEKAHTPNTVLERMLSNAWVWYGYDPDHLENRPILGLVPTGEETMILNPETMEPMEFSADELFQMDLAARVGRYVDIIICDEATSLVIRETGGDGSGFYERDPKVVEEVS